SRRAPMRRPRATPRVGMPSTTRSRAPRFDSSISWEILVNARAISACSSTTRATVRPPSPPHWTVLKGCLSPVSLPPALEQVPLQEPDQCIRGLAEDAEQDDGQEEPVHATIVLR